MSVKASDFKVGQEVRLIANPNKSLVCPGVFWEPEMEALIGEPAIISNIDQFDNTVCVEYDDLICDEQTWWFFPEWLEVVE